MKKLIYLFAMAMLVSGCATNPFKQFYNDASRGMNAFQDPRVIPTAEEPKLYRGGKPEKDELRMNEDNYQLLGYASFNSGEINEKQAIAYGKEIGASVVLLYSKYTNTLSGSVPLTLPDTQTSTTTGMGTVGSTPYFGSFQTTTYGSQTTYMPYNINRYDYCATYWIKLKPLVLGIFYDDLTPETRKQIGSNKGVIVNTVVKGSPAFSADLFKGDVIQKINDNEILDKYSLQGFLKQLAGKKVTFSIVRDGKQLSKTIQLNP